ncbi:phosphoenolpyruvate--protein phosphotransferase [Reinekea sp. G2M2-21]|uniref:phosphoenolpyruvate--protein phosphotransferase n=1 Tax=Reinekea sp. G2M2-21 TaxID=2788942 RepID=UPI0018AAC7B4|nr:phosphoenolpyruvate--protein phosphotransferase [Reinekea sp. G2M2-21]
MNARNTALTAPLDGTLQSIERSADPVFAQRMVGDGVMIEPSSELLLAPCSGTVSQLHDAHHAIAIKQPDGVEVLIHIGIDTVTLKGQGFEPKVALGQTVTQGQPLIQFNKQQIEAQGLSAQTVVLITTGEAIKTQTYPRQIIAQQDRLFEFALADNAEPADDVEWTGADTVTANVVIKNPQGLHARPAAQLVGVVKKFPVQVTLRNELNQRECLATSVTGIMGLQTKLNTALQVTVTGQDAQLAMNAIVEAVEKGLGEDVSPASAGQEVDEEFPVEAPLLQQGTLSADVLQGVKAAQGMAVGFLQVRSKQLPSYPTDGVDSAEEQQQLTYALSQATQGLQQLIEQLQKNQLTTQADVFSAHIELLDDPALISVAQTGIKDGLSAMAAWHLAYTTEAKKLAELDDPLLKARATDIADVGYRVMSLLLGVDEQNVSADAQTILVMDDITPSEIVSLDRESIVGLITIEGGSTSHAAILAGSLGLPYVVNVPSQITQQAAGTRVILNALKGTVQLAPSDAQVADFKTLQDTLARQLHIAQAQAHEAAITEDGVRIEVAANVGSVTDAINAAKAGADGIGLVRSEFLYMDRVSEPSLAEQTDVYRGLLNGIGAQRGCIIRTLDVGGDKPLAYLPMPAEENPFLGERGIRIGLNRPHMLRKQIRAILQAAGAGKPRIMFPMIASLDEFRAAKALVLEEQQRAGVEDLEIGIMVEVPSAALMAEQFATEVDFFSIGTNDLTQYTLAMDRGHPKLAAQVDALHPAVLALIKLTAQASQKHGKWTGICGSIASDPMAVPVLIGLGVTELSTGIPALALIKDKVRHLHMEDCKLLARTALSKGTAAEVRALLQHHAG